MNPLKWRRVCTGHYEADGVQGKYRLALEQVPGVQGRYHLTAEEAASLPWLTFKQLRYGGIHRNLCYVLRVDGELIDNNRFEFGLNDGKRRALTHDNRQTGVKR